MRQFRTTLVIIIVTCVIGYFFLRLEDPGQLAEYTRSLFVKPIEISTLRAAVYFKNANVLTEPVVVKPAAKVVLTATVPSPSCPSQITMDIVLAEKDGASIRPNRDSLEGIWFSVAFNPRRDGTFESTDFNVNVPPGRYVAEYYLRYLPVLLDDKTVESHFLGSGTMIVTED